MNYIERIQSSIDFIESILTTEINLQDVSKNAYMSISTYYRLFYNCVGVTVKEYIRNRRIDIASKLLSDTDLKIMEIAFDSGFESHEVFSRNFKRTTGFSPHDFRKNNKLFFYGKVNLMDKFFEIEDQKLLKKYPDIRTLKDVTPMKVAYYVGYGKNPENEANNVIIEWAKSKGLLDEKSGTKIFGFNNPNPSPGKEEYGYEVWITVNDMEDTGDERIKIKTFPGGKYALLSTTVKEVGNAWKRFSKWLEESDYDHATHQWLEEMVSFNETEEDIGLTLYMPIKNK